MSKGGHTRERILQAAQVLISKKGFACMSIDDILQAAHITKGGFFYHFPSKSDLAVALVKDHLDNYYAIFKSLHACAQEQSADPLQQTLIMLRLLANMCESQALNTMSGVIASYMYENHDFTGEIKTVCEEKIAVLKQAMRQRFESIERLYQPHWPVTPEALADMLLSIFQGSVTLGILTDNKNFLPLQIRRFRHLLHIIYQREAPTKTGTADKNPEPLAG